MVPKKRIRTRSVEMVLLACLVLAASCSSGDDGSEATPPAGDRFGPLRTKAMEHDRWVEQWHTPRYGSHLHVIFADDARTEVGSYEGHGDSCIWTGTYVTSQALRYQVTGDPQARANVIRSVSALSRHLHVTGRPGFIARYVGPADDPGHADYLERCPEDPNCHRVESGPYAGDFWVGNTSRDQYTGWFMGMTFAYDLIDDEAMRVQIAADMTEVLDRLIADRWWIIDADGEPTTKAPNVLSLMQMAWALAGYHITGLERFREVFDAWADPSQQELLRLTNIGILNRYAQHYGLNLAHENFLNLLRLAPLYSDAHPFLVDLFVDQIHGPVDLQHNPWYTAVYLAEGGVTDPELYEAHRAQILEDLTDFRPAPKFRYGMHPPPAELDPVSLELVDLQERFPFLADIMGRANPQALEAYPVRYQCSSGFIFQRNMWAISCDAEEDEPRYVNSGHDYLIAYWLASAYGILDETM